VVSDEYAVPRDVWAERSFVGGLLAAERIPDGLKVDQGDVWDPHLNRVLSAILTLNTAGKPCDAVSVRTELLRMGERGQAVDGAWLADLMLEGAPAGSLGHHAGSLRSLAVRRQVVRLATQALQQANNPSSDPYDVAALLHVDSGELADSAGEEGPQRTTDLHGFLSGEDSYDWLVPGLLERGDRLLLTGGEGSGKSVLSRMLAVTTAAGVHPFKGTRIDPAQVLLVDLENGTRHLRRALRGLSEHAQRIGRPVPAGGLVVESRPSGVDLTKTEDRTWLSRLCQTVRPQLLVIGPLYRMHAADMNAEEPARALTRTIDAIRAEHGCSIVMETHAPHGQAGQIRSLRPVGSSLFLRWPEFGYGLRPKGNDGAVMSLMAWRGPRDERDFPPMLARGGEQEWPWAPYTGITVPDDWSVA
jgi:replicative DNA helicase